MFESDKFQFVTFAYKTFTNKINKITFYSRQIRFKFDFNADLEKIINRTAKSLYSCDVEQTSSAITSVMSIDRLFSFFSLCFND